MSKIYKANCRGEHRTVYGRTPTGVIRVTGGPVPVPYDDFNTRQRYGTGAYTAVDGIITAVCTVVF